MTPDKEVRKYLLIRLKGALRRPLAGWAVEVQVAHKTLALLICVCVLYKADG